MIYFIRHNVAGSPIKIGYTENRGRLAMRLRAFNTFSPWGADGLAYADGGSRRVERALHELLSEYHVRGEWFEPEPVVLEIVAYVKHNPDADPADIIDAARIAIGDVSERPKWVKPTAKQRKRRKRDRLKAQIAAGEIVVKPLDNDPDDQ